MVEARREVRRAQRGGSGRASGLPEGREEVLARGGEGKEGERGVAAASGSAAPLFSASFVRGGLASGAVRPAGSAGGRAEGVTPRLPGDGADFFPRAATDPDL